MLNSLWCLKGPMDYFILNKVLISFFGHFIFDLIFYSNIFLMNFMPLLPTPMEHLTLNLFFSIIILVVPWTVMCLCGWILIIIRNKNKK